jgi:hypothetical protein
MKRQKKKVWWVAGMVLLATAVLSACSGGGSHLLLAQYNRDFEAEIFLTELGADEDAWQSLGDDLSRADRSYFSGNPAFFAPDDPATIILYYDDRGDTVIEVMQVGDDEPQEVHEIGGDFAFPQIFTDPFRIVIGEFEDDEMECFAARAGEEAERIARGNSCQFYPDGVVVLERDRDETTAALVDYNGEEEGLFLDEVEDAQVLAVAPDLKQLLFVERDSRGGQLFTVELDREPEPFGDEFGRIGYAGYLNDDLFYFFGSEDEDDAPSLFVSDQEEPIIDDVDPTFFPRIDSESGNMAFVVEDRGDQVLAVFNVRSGEAIEVAKEENFNEIQFLNSDPPRLLATALDRDEWKLYSADVDGTDVVELLSIEDPLLRGLYYQEGSDRLLVLYADEDGLILFVTSVDEEDGYALLEEWDFLELLAADDEILIFAGNEDRDDDLVLYAIPAEADADLLELDDDFDEEHRVTNAFFTRNGRDLIYTVRDVLFFRHDDVEVRQVPVNGDATAERIFDEVELLDVQWETPRLQQIFVSRP